MALDNISAQIGVHTLARALAGEFRAVHGEDLPVADLATYRRMAAAKRQSALCLSGGGIRSAAFSLGVVQALAQKSLLGKFDYLSTVSGGGFTGGWLQALIREKHGDIAAAEALLREQEAAPAVQALREYTNYLTPRPGLLSEDSWTAIVLYLRNVLINWFAFGPVFVLAVLLAIFYRTLVWTVGMVDWAGDLALAVGCAGLLLSTWRSCLDLPSHRPERPAAPGAPDRVDYLAVAAIRRWIEEPMLVWAFCVPLTMARWLATQQADASWLQGAWQESWLPLVYLFAMMAGYWGAASQKRAFDLYLSNFVAWLLASMMSALLIWFGLHLAYTISVDERAELLAVIGPLWLILANILQSAAHVALRKEARFGDMDREWLARLSALKLRIVVLWTVFAFCCLSLQRVAFHTAGTEWPFWAIPLVTFVSGPAAAWLGKQVLGGVEAVIAKPGSAARLLSRLLPILGAVFGIALFTLLGYFVSECLGLLQRNILPLPEHQALPNGALTHVALIILLVQGGLALGLCLFIWHAMQRIDVNRFSMHGVYRNRLSRAFLGSARPLESRAPDPFTGFDPFDNPRLSVLATAAGPRKLFPVINVTLNLTAATRTAWAERKAAAFTMTPLACGSAELSPPGTPKQEHPCGCYVPSAQYAGQEHETGADDDLSGLSLATAMTISGAAVSPSWGYHSSPTTAFLMTLFNVRLGAWLPNPAVVTDAATLKLARPRNAFAPMLADLLGTTTDAAPAIYLSDGGHFDDLGLYEMLRRRCRLIVVVDADQDGACQFADLGDAIRKSAIDQQVHVRFIHGSRIHARGSDADGALSFAVARIDYPEDAAGDAGQPGRPPARLLYIKPCYLNDIPADVRAYGAQHPEFPHESTLDQWFTESQFESYRGLGQHQMSGLLDLMEGGTGLDALLDAAELEQVGPELMFDPDQVGRI